MSKFGSKGGAKLNVVAAGLFSLGSAGELKAGGVGTLSWIGFPFKLLLDLDFLEMRE
jgi:hypothetical protein